MEAAVVLAFVGAVIAAAVVGLWSGVSMVTGMPMPDEQQVKGAMLIGFFGVPLVIGAVLAVMGAVESR